MSKSRKLALFVFLLIGLSFLTVIPLTNAFSETIHLTAQHWANDSPVVRTVELNQGDRITGDFTFSNIPVWNSNGITNMTYPHSFALEDPSGNTILSYTSGNSIFSSSININHESFDVTALASGVYKFSFDLQTAVVYRDSAEIANAQVTFNYNIVEPTPTPTQNIGSIFDSGQIIIVIVVVVCFVGAAFYLYSQHKASPKPQSVYPEQNQTKLSSSKIVCGSCSTINDIDAGYCKKCGRQLV